VRGEFGLPDSERDLPRRAPRYGDRPLLCLRHADRRHPGTLVLQGADRLGLSTLSVLRYPLRRGSPPLHGRRGGRFRCPGRANVARRHRPAPVGRGGGGFEPVVASPCQCASTGFSCARFVVPGLRSGSQPAVRRSRIVNSIVGARRSDAEMGCTLEKTSLTPRVGRGAGGGRTVARVGSPCRSRRGFVGRMGVKCPETGSKRRFFGGIGYVAHNGATAVSK